MAVDGGFSLTPVYDRVARETGLFDYDALAETIVRELGNAKLVLELCIGTANLGVKVAAKGVQLTGLDVDRQMLKLASGRIVHQQELGESVMIDLEYGSVLEFRLRRTFPLIYTWSGFPIVAYRPSHPIGAPVPMLGSRHIQDEELTVDGMFTTDLHRFLENVRDHLEPQGALLIGVEQWEPEPKQGEGSGSLRVILDDGSIYWRLIAEDNAIHGSRFHVFFDRPTGRFYTQAVERSFRVSFNNMKEILAAVGFQAPTRTEDNRFVVCRRK
jgi:SAM-dependent methyltransferase